MQEAVIRKIAVQNQPRQIVRETLPQKTLSQNIGLVEWLKGPEFKPQHCK
jgi:hypothetical protein